MPRLSIKSGTTILTSSGVISNAKQLDADNKNAYYELAVTAQDERVYTKNKNDEEPKFCHSVFTPNVNENAGPNTQVHGRRRF